MIILELVPGEIFMPLANFSEQMIALLNLSLCLFQSTVDRNIHFVFVVYFDMTLPF